MAYVLAWILYLLMAALLLAAYERYVALHLANRRLRVSLRALMAIGLFTPGFVSSAEGLSVVPACIAVLFNVLAHSGPGLMKAVLPLLLSTSLVFAVLWLLERRGRKPAAPVADAA